MSQWIALLVGLGCLLMGVKFGGGEVIFFIDLTSLLIVFVMGFCFASSAHGFLRVLSALVAGFSPTRVTDEDSLRDAMILQSLRNAICTAAGVGYLIGVIQMLTNLADPSAIGPAMAVALLTTLYGAMIANCIFMPIVTKLEGYSAHELLYREMVVMGLKYISRGESPRNITDQLVALMPPKIQAQIEEAA